MTDAQRRSRYTELSDQEELDEWNSQNTEEQKELKTGYSYRTTMPFEAEYYLRSIWEWELKKEWFEDDVDWVQDSQVDALEVCISECKAEERGTWARRMMDKRDRSNEEKMAEYWEAREEGLSLSVPTLENCDKCVDHIPVQKTK